MNIPLLFLVHWLHVLSAILWFGGYAFATFVVWPALFRRPPAEARGVFDALDGPIGAFIGTTAQLTFWLGLLRGTVFGPVRSFDALLHTPYGHRFLAALVLTLVAIVVSALASRHYVAIVWDGDTFKPGAEQAIRRSNLWGLSIMSLVLVIMVSLRFGL